MKINFTKHAKIRCIQRKIPEPWVEDMLNKIPLSPGEHNLLVEGTNLIVVFEDGETERSVITLYAKPVSQEVVKRKSKELAKQPHFKDMLNKEMNKRERRTKQSRKPKFKNKKH